MIELNCHFDNGLEGYVGVLLSRQRIELKTVRSRVRIACLAKMLTQKSNMNPSSQYVSRYSGITGDKAFAFGRAGVCSIEFQNEQNSAVFEPKSDLLLKPFFLRKS